MRPEALEFFKNNYSYLYKAIIFEWAKFIEKINPELPMIISKIEGEEIGRISLRWAYEILKNDFPECFYCGDTLLPDRIHTPVDHVIPRSYVFNDDLWNLVLSCDRCNGNKSGSLPPLEYIDKLISRNQEYFKEIEKLERCLLRLDPKEWEKAVFRIYYACEGQGFSVIPKAIITKKSEIKFDSTHHLIDCH